MADSTTPAAETGASTRIRRSGASQTRKKKASTIPIGIVVFVLIVVIGVLFAADQANLAFFWFTGTVFGYILQKARFCFTASLRDPYLTGGTSLTKAVLTAFAVTTVGFWAIQYSAASAGLPIPGASFVAPISLHTAVGGVLFGIGMVISGGCASGTLMRVGEGFMMQMLSIVFFVVGSVLGAAHFGWWMEKVIVHGRAIHLAEVFGWFGALVVQLVTIALLWIAADKFAKAKQGAAAH